MKAHRILGGWLLLLLMGCQSEPPLALGTLERDRVAHTATTNEVVVALPVKQGSYVTEGTVLVKLDDQQQQAVLARAKAQLLQAEASLEKLRNGAREEELAAAKAQLASAKATLLEREQNLTRTKNLATRNIASQADLEHAQAGRDAASANHQSMEQQLKALTRGARDEDLRMAEAVLMAAQAVVASEQKHLADLTIVATREGILDNLPWNLGERVTSGSPLAILLAGKAPYARIYLPEPYRVQVKLGDQLKVHVDGLDKALIGEVRWIASEPAFTPYYALNQEQRSRLMYLTEVQLADTESALPSGLPVQVELP